MPGAHTTDAAPTIWVCPALAALGRRVHHRVILALTLPRYRLEASTRQTSAVLSVGGSMVRQATGTIILADQKKA